MDTFRGQLYDGWHLVYDGPCPHKAFKVVTQENEFVSSSASLGIPFWARVLPSISAFVDHHSLRDGVSTASAMPIHAGTSSTFSLATSSSPWSSFYYSWVAGNISRMQLLHYATPQYVDKYFRGTVIVLLSSWTPLAICTSPTVPLPSTSTVAGSFSVASSRVRLLPARSRSPRRSKVADSR